MEDQAILNKKAFQEEKRKKVAKPLLWIGMVSIVMFFAGLTSAAIVSNGDGKWIVYDIPQMFLWSCVVIGISSITLIAANIFAKKNNVTTTKLMVGVTLLLGFVFIYTQFSGAVYFVRSRRIFYRISAESGRNLFLFTGICSFVTSFRRNYRTNRDVF